MDVTDAVRHNGGRLVWMVDRPVRWAQGVISEPSGVDHTSAAAGC
ncbi:hypothetical protein AB0G54_29915 [Streptomyces yokosukanensis]|nr:hypothetical protein [Streptomyces yokosukanensis]